MIRYLLLFALLSCSHLPKIKTRETKDVPKEETSKPAEEKVKLPDTFDNLSITFVLGGIDAKSIVHAGIIKGLEDHKIKPTHLVASGLGAFTASIYASEKSSFSLEWKLFKLKKDIYFNPSFFKDKKGKISPETLLTFFSNNLQSKRIESTDIPLSIVTTDLFSGETRTFTRGPLPEILYASMAIPGIFIPMEIDDYQLVYSPKLLRVALKERTDAIIYIDLNAYWMNRTKTDTDDIIFSYLNTQEPTVKNRRIITIRPNLSKIRPFDFHKRREIVNIGIKTIENEITRIKKALRSIQRRKK